MTTTRPLLSFLRRRDLGLAFLAVLLLGGIVPSSRCPASTMTTSIDVDAPVVVIGHVRSIEATRGSDYSIASTIEVQAEELLKGAVPGTNLKVQIQGGRIGTSRYVVSGAPTFEVGEHVLLFLVYNPDGTFRVNRRAEGKFRLVPDQSGALQAVPDKGGRQVSTASHDGVERTAMPRADRTAMPLSDIRDAIRPGAPTRKAEPSPDIERLRPLFSRKGGQGGGAGGVVEQWPLADNHALVLLYINNEHQPDSHGVFVVDTRSREPVLALGFMGSYAGQDTCRKIVSAKPGEVVISTNGCMYGGDERTKFSFDLESGRVVRQDVSPPEPPQLRSRAVAANIEKAVVNGKVYEVTHNAVRRGDETVFELPASSEASCTRAGLYNCDADWIEDSARVNSVLVHEERIWVGFSISNGEGYQGIGGLGFFDTKTGKPGLLRHPVLVGLSVMSFDVTANEITVVNQPSYEGVPSPFESVHVMRIARSTLYPGGAHLRDWSPEERKAIERLGADQFMIDRYAWEHEQAKVPPDASQRE